jgi:hypothetical protein
MKKVYNDNPQSLEISPYTQNPNGIYIPLLSDNLEELEEMRKTPGG